MKYLLLVLVVFRVCCYVPLKDLPDNINQVKLGPNEKILNKDTIINTKTGKVRTPEIKETREQQINLLKAREKAGGKKLTPEEQSDYDYLYKQKHYTGEKTTKNSHYQDLNNQQKILEKSISKNADKANQSEVKYQDVKTRVNEYKAGINKDWTTFGRDFAEEGMLMYKADITTSLKHVKKSLKELDEINKELGNAIVDSATTNLSEIQSKINSSTNLRSKIEALSEFVMYEDHQKLLKLEQISKIVESALNSNNPLSESDKNMLDKAIRDFQFMQKSGNENPYSVLDVPENSSSKFIKNAFNQKTKNLNDLITSLNKEQESLKAQGKNIPTEFKDFLNNATQKLNDYKSAYSQLASKKTRADIDSHLKELSDTYNTDSIQSRLQHLQKVENESLKELNEEYLKVMKKDLGIQNLQKNINENRITIKKNLDLNIRARESRDNIANNQLRDYVTEKTLKAETDTTSRPIDVIRSDRSYSAPADYTTEPIEPIHMDIDY